MTKLQLCVVVLAIGCKNKDEPKPEGNAATADPKAVEKSKPTETKPVAPADQKMCGDAKSPDWLKAIPAAAPKAKVGDTVWAVAIGGDPAEVSMQTFKVDAIDGTTVTVSREGRDDKPRVCGSLVFPYAGPSALKAGDIAMVESQVTNTAMYAVKVTKVEGDSITTVHQMVDSVAEETASIGQPIPTGIVPLGYVAYKRDGNIGLRTGYVLATIGDKTAVLNMQFKDVDTLPTSALHAVRTCPKDFAVGDAVTAINEQRDHLHNKGKITKVIQPLLYEVDFDNEKAVRVDCTHLADTKAF